ncbi:unnamed protein product [Moneuplotes crassus]|uniref:Uncharacterized protein n=1 Tax=Euplotes crassus TaxID=5936 RepID=A0AAD1TZZ5_EUPCR|nr:unnamed protein product [Moneuplotes crassus]
MNQAKELKCPKDSKEPSTVRQKEAKLKSQSCDKIRDRRFRQAAPRKEFNRARYIEFLAYNQFCSKTKNELARIKFMLLQDNFQQETIELINKTTQIFQEVAQRANEIYKENQKSKQDLLDQISDYEALLQDRQGLEMAYRRMHEINHLVKDIETFCASKYNRKLRDIIIDLPSEILRDNPRIDEDVIKFSSNMINSLYTHKIDHESSKCDCNTSKEEKDIEGDSQSKEDVKDIYTDVPYRIEDPYMCKQNTPNFKAEEKKKRAFPYSNLEVKQKGSLSAKSLEGLQPTKLGIKQNFIDSRAQNGLSISSNIPQTERINNLKALKHSSTHTDLVRENQIKLNDEIWEKSQSLLNKLTKEKSKFTKYGKSAIYTYEKDKSTLKSKRSNDKFPFDVLKEISNNQKNFCNPAYKEQNKRPNSIQKSRNASLSAKTEACGKSSQRSRNNTVRSYTEYAPISSSNSKSEFILFEIVKE